LYTLLFPAWDHAVVHPASQAKRDDRQVKEGYFQVKSDLSVPARFGTKEERPPQKQIMVAVSGFPGRGV
jgi:hypothetical protein